MSDASRVTLSHGSDDSSSAAAPQEVSQSSLAPWLQGLISALLIFHCVALVSMVLARPTGPWVVIGGQGMASPPRFADEVVDLPPVRGYLQAIRLTDAYRSLWNGVPEQLRLVANLQNEDGETIAEVTLPDPNASAAVQQRQYLIAMGLHGEEMLDPPTTESVPAPGQAAKTVMYFRPREGRIFERVEIEERLLPRNRPSSAPTEWAMINAQALTRHLCDKHGAAKAELRILIRPLIPPDVVESPPPGTNFNDITKILGVFHGRDI